jgi:tetratricopeptide (TPR) repeat protein
MKLYDCFIFNNEFDLLEIRLKYLWDLVDVFVLVESDTTFAGKEKPLHFEENKERFKWAESKIKHIVKKVDREKIDFSDESIEGSIRHATFRWDIERAQRNHIGEGIKEANDEDLIMMSDVDEIPRKSIVEEIRNNGLPRDDKPMFFNMIMHYYALNCQAVGEENRWFRASSIFKKGILGKPLVTYDDGMTLVEDPVTGKGIPEGLPEFMKEDLKSMQEELIAQYPLATLQKLRDSRWTMECYENGGWHFSYVGDAEFIKNKLASISHTEYDTPEYKNDERIKKARVKGNDLFDRKGYKFKYVDIDSCQDYDEELKKLLKNYQSLIESVSSNKVRVCLNMIVKNESKIIERCLNSVAPHIDCYVICDTGSTDDTKEKITKVMKKHGVIGEIHDIEFRDFGYARNKALELAKQSQLDFDYILLDDADMDFEVVEDDWKEKLTADYYTVKQYNSMSYHNTRLLKRSATTKYLGVTHEYVDCSGKREKLDSIQYFDRACGSSRKEKFVRDAGLLQAGLKEEPKGSPLHTRYIFYLAQTYFDMGEFLKSIECYKKRADAGGFDEEIYYSWYRIGAAYQRLGDEKEMLNAFLKAYNLRPTRIEPLYELASYYRTVEKYHSGYMFAKMSSMVNYPEDVLFIAKNVYEWKRWDELAICAYWIGSYKESYDIYFMLLDGSLIPEDHLERVKKNMAYAKDKLQ